MDPLCHTLVGATLGCTGLQKTTRYSRVILIVAANLPDIDVITHFMDGNASYAFRRGITHGLPALIVLPLLLTLLILGWHRLRRGSEKGTGPPVSPRWLLALSLIGVWSHPTLDWMNTYGMRWLMPMVDKWYYGDTLFIMDWIIWLALAAALLASRSRALVTGRWYGRPATLGLAFLVGYIAFNFNVTRLAESTALQALEANPPKRLLASPIPLNPLRRELVLEYAEEYRFAAFVYSDNPSLAFHERVVPKGRPEDLERVRSIRDGRRFLHWARFPYSVAETVGDRRRITVADARYVPDIDNPRIDGFAVFRTEVPLDSPPAISGR